MLLVVSAVVLGQTGGVKREAKTQNVIRKTSCVSRDRPIYELRITNYELRIYGVA